MSVDQIEKKLVNLQQLNGFTAESLVAYGVEIGAISIKEFGKYLKNKHRSLNE